jgi:hypothetical protein
LLGPSFPTRLSSDRGGAGNDTFLASLDGAIDDIWGDRGFDTSVGDPDELLTGIEQIL